VTASFLSPLVVVVLGKFGSVDAPLASLSNWTVPSARLLVARILLRLCSAHLPPDNNKYNSRLSPRFFSGVRSLLDDADGPGASESGSSDDEGAGSGSAARHHHDASGMEEAEEDACEDAQFTKYSSTARAMRAKADKKKATEKAAGVKLSEKAPTFSRRDGSHCAGFSVAFSETPLVRAITTVLLGGGGRIGGEATAAAVKQSNPVPQLGKKRSRGGGSASGSSGGGGAVATTGSAAIAAVDGVNVKECRDLYHTKAWTFGEYLQNLKIARAADAADATGADDAAESAGASATI